ncbi:HigA family addiction module antitoxin [Thioalkalivibrio sp. HK1]|uniref:HigA family addiction module antitoxin n=1 Tax=Thioalkalivibrio sp. HK1 TaxID=1469245 RepID=UPI00047028D4|nr:HigA family addiction module antitoxin [Thioalkalivibrio sp. HK1]
MSLLTDPSHPGEVLSELYLEPLDMKATTLAAHLGVPHPRIERLLEGQSTLDADIAIRLARFFGTTPEYWLNLQRNRDLSHARKTIDVSSIKPLEAG